MTEAAVFMGSMYVVGLLTGGLISTIWFAAFDRTVHVDASDLTPDELEHLIALQAKIKVR